MAAASDRTSIRSEFALADTTEANARVAADNVLDARLDTLEGDSSTAGSLANVAAVALAARNAIQADVDQNEADSDAAHGDATADRALIRVQMNAADSAATTDRGAIRTEFAAADATEKARAEAAEAVLQGNIDTEKGRIDAILDAAGADPDSFADVVELINSVDLENDDALAAYVVSNNAALAAVQADVDQNEADADAAVLGEKTRAEAAEAVLTAAVASEETARLAGDATLQSNLDSEASAREQADNSLTADLGNEASARAQADNGLDQRIVVLEAFDSRVSDSVVIEHSAGSLSLSAGLDEPRMVMTKTAAGDVDVCFDLG